jgi:single-strand DNA-binding protein
VNLSILRGQLSSPPRSLVLPSGDEAVTLELSVRAEGQPTDTVPVTWFEPGAEAGSWAAGTELVVIGRVRRRFFRAGGRTASRTEVLATHVLPAGRRAVVRRRVERSLDEARAALG